MPMDDGNGGEGAEPSVSRVGVRVRPFYPAKPTLWFASLENQFALANIFQDTTKYHYAVPQLEPIYAYLVEDVITAPVTADQYERLKSKFIKRLTAREKQMKQLFHLKELVTESPRSFCST